MLKSRQDLNNYLDIEVRKCSLQKDRLKLYYKLLMENHGIPIAESSDYLTMRRGVDECSDFRAYCLLETFDKDRIPEYYNEEEIKNYSVAMIEKETITFPYCIPNMVEITSGTQWIGKITIKELMRLRNAQLINYNENAQRTMKRIINNGQEYYKIAINKAAVSAIRESYERESYIPNTITLNIGTDCDYYYKNNSLVFNSPMNFDIIDGYHRYVAMGQIYDINNDFDYPMELRIVAFDESTAQQFIYQEDQKTKMRKVDSDALNQFDTANIIVQRLNTSSIMRGNITRNNGLINAGDFAYLINYFVIAGTPKKRQREIGITYSQMLSDKLDKMISNDTYFLNNKWSFVDIMIFLTLATITNVEPENYTNIIKGMSSDEELKRCCSSRRPKKSEVDYIIRKAGE